MFQKSGSIHLILDPRRASKGFLKDGNKNRLRAQDIQRPVEFDGRACDPSGEENQPLHSNLAHAALVGALGCLQLSC